jgi:hypothetical protein
VAHESTDTLHQAAGLTSTLYLSPAAFRLSSRDSRTSSAGGTPMATAICSAFLGLTPLRPFSMSQRLATDTPMSLPNSLRLSSSVIRKVLINSPDATFATSGKAQDPLADKNGLGQSFTINAKEAGAYHVRVWAMGANGDGAMAVYLDSGASPVGSIQTSDEGWKFYPLTSLAKNDTLKLSAGSHTFSVRLKGGHAPQVEFFQIAKAQFAATEADNTYANFISSLRKNVLPADYEVQKRLNGLPQTDYVPPPATVPPYDYCYQLDKSFTYTYWSTTLYLYAGQQITLETRKSNPCASDPVLYLFKTYNRSTETWSNDDTPGNCYQSKISVTIPTTGTGYYMVLARAYSSLNPGTSDLYKDGQLYASDIALGGTLGLCGNKTGTLNFFTAKITYDSMLFLARPGDSFTTGPITDMNDDYYGSGDFSWGVASRIHRTSSDIMGAAILSAYSSYWVPGRADLYLENWDSPWDVLNAFPNLKSDDAIRTAPDTGQFPPYGAGDYRCFSWAGGNSTTYVKPTHSVYGLPWYVENNPELSLDNWFGNMPPRYIGAMKYTNSGATYDSSIVDVWKQDNVYTHASVRKPGNDHAHGYDWESKPGQLSRTMHPRHALRGATYGDVVRYYIKDTGAAAASEPEMSMEESIGSGLSVTEHPSLSASQTVKLAALKAKVLAPAVKEFNGLYATWQSTWIRPEIAVSNDPDGATRSKEYDDLLRFCQLQGMSSLPLMFQKFMEGGELAILPILALTPGKGRCLTKSRRSTNTSDIRPTDSTSYRRLTQL